MEDLSPKAFFCRAAAATMALAAIVLFVGCADYSGYSGYSGSYQSTATTIRSGGTVAQTSVPKTKKVVPSGVSRVAAAPSVKRTAPVAAGGSVDDIVARIQADDRAKAAKAREEEDKRREEWLVAHEGEMPGVRSRLSSMRIFAAFAGEDARRAVDGAIDATCAEIDALRAKVGSGAAPFDDVSRIRVNLESRHEKLRQTCAEYRDSTDN